MENVRIDKGIKRGPRKTRLANQPIDTQTGQFLPISTPAQRTAAILDAIPSLERGETTDQIAARHNLPGRTLRAWLISEPEANEARARLVAHHLSRTLEEMSTADGPLPLARAREEFRGWAWIGERRLPEFYGQKQEITHNINTDLGEKLRRAKERIVAPQLVQDSTAIIDNATDVTPIESDASKK